MKAIVWMHRDLRLADHPALCGALATVAEGVASRVEVVYAWSDCVYGDWMPGQAQQGWIYEHLQDVLLRLSEYGVRLRVTRQAPSVYVARARGVHGVHFNDPLLPAARQEADRLCREATHRGIAVTQYSGDLLHDPGCIRTQQGNPYSVFTPFSRRFREQVPDEQCEPLAVDWSGGYARGGAGAEAGGGTARARVCAETAHALAHRAQEDLDALGLHAQHIGARPLEASFEVGEAAAHRRLETFAEGPIMGYADRRNWPHHDGTSRLSPYLAIGVLSPRQVFTAVLRARNAAASDADARGVETYVQELIWREFAYHLLHHFPGTPSEPLRLEWSRFPWRDDPAAYVAWQQGRTGFPIVDAGMRQLSQTGWMHNRVRMITASFLTKDLMISWQQGAQWFWHSLIDADLASNTLGWQWAGGCGADAQPYIRIFNPETQLRKHDPDGRYVRTWIHELGDSAYPAPMVDHAVARGRALGAYTSFRKKLRA